MDSLPQKPFVVFYDCCVPRRQFRSIIPPVARFADHIFVRDIFSEKICRNDQELFKQVETERRNSFAGCLFALFITTDGKFSKQVGYLLKDAMRIKLIHIDIGPQGTMDRNWLSAVELAVKLAEVYARIRERAFRRSEPRESFLEFCRELLDERFGK